MLVKCELGSGRKASMLYIAWCVLHVNGCRVTSAVDCNKP